MPRPFGAVSGKWKQSDPVSVRESWHGEDYLNRTKVFSNTIFGFSFFFTIST